MKRSPINRGTSQLKRSSFKAKRTRLKTVGKKTLAWSETRKELKARFEAIGITACERCGIGDCLSFAHRYKRNKISTQAELETVALLCMPPSHNDCHGHLERMSHEDMYHGITSIIEKRERQP